MLILHTMQDNISPPDLNDSGSNNPILTLGELSQSLKKTVESVYDHVRVKAEVSRPVRAASGHVYFTLKDDTATLDAVCWKTVAGSLQVQPEEGLEVIATGKLTTYPGRSKYQIVIKSLEIAGEGALLKQLEERKQRLASEGLFDPHLKKPIPTMPMTIGVVTSPTGAVIRDILHRLRERFPVQVLVWPVLVQGEGAAAEITAAIKGFDELLDQTDNAVPVPDLVIVARGGGSLEDLMAFNEENVVRAVAQLRLPVISAVGHETDHTLIDLAADLRAPTPTAAAELATPVKAELDARLGDLDIRLARNLSQRIESSGQHLRNLGRALGDPEMLLSQKAQQLDLHIAALDRHIDSRLAKLVEKLRSWSDRLPLPAEQLARAESRLAALESRVAEAINQRLTKSQKTFTQTSDRLKEPDHLLTKSDARLALLNQRLETVLEGRLTTSKTMFEQAERLLEASSFQRVLDRGFALVTGPDGQVMRSSKMYDEGDAIQIKLADGARSANLGAENLEKVQKAPKSAPKKVKPKDTGQGDLF